MSSFENMESTIPDGSPLSDTEPLYSLPTIHQPTLAACRISTFANQRRHMAQSHRLDTDQKALELNLDPAIYGTFAEIGAGQEVARIFFKVGAAAGTIAKTMSASATFATS